MESCPESAADCIHIMKLTLTSVDYCRHSIYAFRLRTLMPFLSLLALHTKPRSLFSQISFQLAGMVLHSQILSRGRLWRSSVLGRSG